MKKKMFLTVCLAMLGIIGMKAQIAILALHHQGNVKTYGFSDVSKALDDAVDGDTIYLSEGYFPYDFKITKKISIIGAGMETIIKGDVTINIPDSVTLTSRMLQNIDIQGSISIYKPVSGFVISQCRFEAFDFYANVSNCLFDRVYCIRRFLMNEGYTLAGTQVLSSKISMNSGDAPKADDIIFDHCNIKFVYNGSDYLYRGTYINCICNSIYSAGVFKNCLAIYENSNNINGWYNENLTFDDELNVTTPDAATLAQYIGTDGTVVGITGGDEPFTLVSPGLQVTEHNLEVDNIERKLKVSLKLGNK